jgi:hypothetical protein
LLLYNHLKYHTAQNIPLNYQYLGKDKNNCYYAKHTYILVVSKTHLKMQHMYVQ